MSSNSSEPEGITARPINNTSDSELLDMHYFLTEDDKLGNDEAEERF